jgi:hypothetical protein
LNGNRSISESSTFQLGRTRFWYRRGPKEEILEGRGHPLSEEIDIMILILNNDLIKIKCHYWQLTNKSKSQANQSFYQWTWENDTQDDCFCETRQAHCALMNERNESVLVADHLCDAKKRPKAWKCRNQGCTRDSPSAPRWHIGAWRTCEGRCWPQEAIQRRSLLCIRTLPNKQIHTIPTGICLRFLAIVPITVRECPTEQSSTLLKCNSLKSYSRWTTGPWIGVSVS